MNEGPAAQSGWVHIAQTAILAPKKGRDVCMQGLPDEKSTGRLPTFVVAASVQQKTPKPSAGSQRSLQATTPPFSGPDPGRRRWARCRHRSDRRGKGSSSTGAMKALADPDRKSELCTFMVR